jgi:hypothetical protein
MNTPNESLMNKYGTAVEPGIPKAVQIAAALLGFSLLMGERANRKKTREEAERLNVLARAMEEERMKATIDALSKEGAFRSQYLAEGIGSFMAKVATANDESLSDEQKRAITEFITKTGRAGLIGRLIRGGAKPPPIPAAAKRVPPMQGVGAPGARPAPPSISMQGAMPGARAPGRAAPPQPAARPAARPAPRPAARPAARPAPERAAPATAVSRRPTRPAVAAAPAAAPAAAAKPTAAPAAAPASAATGGGIGLKGKLVGGALLAGTGYAGLKGAETARDFMMIPSQETRWGGMPPRSRISPYGYSY